MSDSQLLHPEWCEALRRLLDWGLRCRALARESRQAVAGWGYAALPGAGWVDAVRAPLVVLD